MKKTVVLMVLAAATIIFCAHQARAAKLDEDVCQSMYFRRSAYVEKDPNMGLFKEELKQREKEALRLEGKRKLKKAWVARISRDNEDFVDAKEDIKTIKPGLSTKRDILDIPRMPAYIVDPSRPWKMISWRMREYLKYGGYPDPGYAQKIFGGRYYFTEMNLPRMGIRQELLATVNKSTKRVDVFRYYLEPGYILDYRMVD